MTLFCCALAGIKDLFSILSSCSVLVAAYTFYLNNRLKRAEWLKTLFEKFYEGPNYKDVRRWIDFDRLEEELLVDIDGVKEEKFSDFLNFFEFIAVLEKEKQLGYEEIKSLFAYYFRLIDQNEFCKNYIYKNRYKNLYKFLRKYDF